MPGNLLNYRINDLSIMEAEIRTLTLYLRGNQIKFFASDQMSDKTRIHKTNKVSLCDEQSEDDLFRIRDLQSSLGHKSLNVEKKRAAFK
jgi:hypothetical protein